jgi:2-phosphosulfolactate phosphatase
LFLTELSSQASERSAVRECILNVYNLPQHVPATGLGGSVVIVVDLLRASTTICQALASGAREVVPFLEVEQARAASASGQRSEIILGGERGGKRIPGFDLGNSPAEYTLHAVQDRRVFFTTTNGTRALEHACFARRVLVGALANLSAVVGSVKDEPCVNILCAGTRNEETREDMIAAGALASRLAEVSAHSWKANESAGTAIREWQRILAIAHADERSIDEQLALELRDTPGGRDLLSIGLDQDLVDCAQVDRLNVVPEFDVRARRLLLSQ